MENLTQNEVNELLSGNVGDYKFYEPTVEDQNKNVTFYDFALDMLESVCFYLSNLSMIHDDYVKYSYKSPYKMDNIIALEDSIRLCKQSLKSKQLSSCTLSNYKRRTDIIKWRLYKIKKNGLFDEHKKYLPFIQKAYIVIKESLQE